MYSSEWQDCEDFIDFFLYTFDKVQILHSKHKFWAKNENLKINKSLCLTIKMITKLTSAGSHPLQIGYMILVPFLRSVELIRPVILHRFIEVQGGPVSAHDCSFFFCLLWSFHGCTIKQSSWLLETWKSGVICIQAELSHHLSKLLQGKTIVLHILWSYIKKGGTYLITYMMSPARQLPSEGLLNNL